MNVLGIAGERNGGAPDRRSGRELQISAAAVASGFNKAKVDHGSPTAGNRYVIVRYENEAAYDKYWNGGGKEWIDKNAPEARNVIVQGIEAK